MAKKSKINNRKSAKKATGSKATAVRHTAMPRAVVRPSTLPTNKPANHVTHEMIAERAYHIAMSGTGGSQDENWHRAERELREKSTGKLAR